MSESLVFRLQERAKIRRQAKGRKSVAEGKPDRISDLLEEAADQIFLLQKEVEMLSQEVERLEPFVVGQG